MFDSKGSHWRVGNPAVIQDILVLNERFWIWTGYLIILKNHYWDFPGGAVVKNPPDNARDTGSSPGPGRSHMPRSN